MDQKALVRAVAERTSLSREESADITRAVVEGLADQVSEGEARRFALDLPEQLADQMQVQRRRRQGAHPIDVTDFVRQVGERAGLPEGDARAGTGAVLAALRDGLGQDNYSHITGQLPTGYSELVEAVRR
jgi:uncharacterized protein (DUF2267 family)